jgi:hypothetical protein
MKNGFQKDRPLPLKAPLKEGIYQRGDSRFWQARYFDKKGKLHRRSTGTAIPAAARQWLAAAKQEADRVCELPPPESAASDSDLPQLLLL